MPRYHLTWKKIAEIDRKQATAQITKEITILVSILAVVFLIGIAR